MKFRLIVILFAATVAFSCSKDENQSGGSEAIIGTWFATELQIDNETASDSAKNGRDALNYLTPRDCYIIKFVFNLDLSVRAENSVNYVEQNVNEEGTGLEIPCPTESDVDNSTYTFDGTTLSILSSTGETVTANARINGNTLSIDASGLDIPNFNASGELVFKRQ